jgi:hypothetical protein
MRAILASVAALTLLLTGLNIAPSYAADVTAFSKSCSGSEAMKAMFASKGGDRVQPDMDTLCKCTAAAFAPKATQAQLDLLAANVSGSMTAAQKDAYENDDATVQLANDSMNGCLESTGVGKDYGD